MLQGPLRIRPKGHTHKGHSHLLSRLPLMQGRLLTCRPIPVTWQESVKMGFRKDLPRKVRRSHPRNLPLEEGIDAAHMSTLNLLLSVCFHVYLLSERFFLFSSQCFPSHTTIYNPSLFCFVVSQFSVVAFIRFLLAQSNSLHIAIHSSCLSTLFSIC